MESLVWLEGWLNEHDGQDFIMEASEDDNGNRGFKAALKESFAAAAADIKKFIQQIIDKIKDMVRTIQMKYAKIKFSRMIKNIGKDYIKEIKAVNGSKEITTLAIELVKNMNKYSAEVMELNSKFLNGKYSYEQYQEAIHKLDLKAEQDANICEQKLDRLTEDAGNVTAEKIWKIGGLLSDYDTALSKLIAVNGSGEKVIEKYLSDLSNTNLNKVCNTADVADDAPESVKSKAKSPGIVKQAIHLAASSLSKIWAKISSFISKALACITRRGDRAARKAAGGSADGNVNESFEEAWSEISQMLDGCEL